MKFLIVSGNPKDTGLCRAITDSIAAGARDGGAEVVEINVNNMPRCKVCGGGWGTCRDRKCAFGTDGFDEARAQVQDADAIAFVSPVYWQDLAEGMKCFLDRLRRCDRAMGEGTASLANKPVIIVASAGGSGRGTIQCLENLERFCGHMGAPVFDAISQNRWNSDYKQAAAYAAAKALASGRKHGDTL